jgi:hypothetical protein
MDDDFVVRATGFTGRTIDLDLDGQVWFVIDHPF